MLPRKACGLKLTLVLNVNFDLDLYLQVIKIEIDWSIFWFWEVWLWQSAGWPISTYTSWVYSRLCRTAFASMLYQEPCCESDVFGFLGIHAVCDSGGRSMVGYVNMMCLFSRNTCNVWQRWMVNGWQNLDPCSTVLKMPVKLDRYVHVVLHIQRMVFDQVEKDHAGIVGNKMCLWNTYAPILTLHVWPAKQGSFCTLMCTSVPCLL